MRRTLRDFNYTATNRLPTLGGPVFRTDDPPPPADGGRGRGRTGGGGRRGRRDEPLTDEDIARQVEQFIRNQGGERQAVEALRGDNFRLRVARRDLKARVEELEDLVPADGQVVVKKEDADELAKFRALGKYEDVEKGLANEKKLKEDAALAAQDTLAEKAAKANGMNPAILKKAVRTEKLTVEELTETVDGKQVAVYYLKGSGDNAPRDKVAAYAKQHLTEWPLTAGATDANATGGGDTGGFVDPGFIALPDTGTADTGGGSGGGDVLSKFLSSKEAARKVGTNPLVPQSTTAK